MIRSSLRACLAALLGTPLIAAALVVPAAPAGAATSANTVFDRMTDPQRVGQLFMAALPSTASIGALDGLINTHHVGNVILQGHWNGASGVQRAANHLQALTRVNAGATRNVRLYVAGDQEGGLIQPFKGSGFHTIPTALNQGTHTATWQQYWAQVWGKELRAAGVNLDLAPVADTVPSAAVAAVNPPIGQLDREFSYSVKTNNSHVFAFVRGMKNSRVATVVKHFPGLGRVRANTDTATHVVDSVTTFNSQYLPPFENGVRAGARMVMISLAYYTQIDGSSQAAFSHRIVTDLLRKKLGYHGVVISDSLGAASASNFPPGYQAIRFLNAGGDMILQTNDSAITQMQHSILVKMSQSPTFRNTVYAAVKRVLAAKQADGLLP